MGYPSSVYRAYARLFCSILTEGQAIDQSGDKKRQPDQAVSHNALERTRTSTPEGTGPQPAAYASSATRAIYGKLYTSPLESQSFSHRINAGRFLSVTGMEGNG